MSRKALQIVVGILSLAPITLGLMGFFGGAGRYPEVSDPSLDSNLRFLSALMFG